jgi:20S proteasome subunit alpha 2
LSVALLFYVFGSVDQSFFNFSHQFLPLHQYVAKNGVVVATEKKLHPLMDESSVQKVFNLTDNIGVVYSGIGPDVRVLIRKGRKKAQAYFRIFHDPIPTAELVKELAAIMQEYTQSG